MDTTPDADLPEDKKDDNVTAIEDLIAGVPDGITNQKS